ncbi:hypothetical protein CFO_g3481 [Ceratocystis platani]|uniref:Altered inheritance of mitochondria protein 11 n=1 Tax=Ceratocystis fimbriata f. sp. platani TaxID=88771 RepID=A0A0F8B2P9_CERFI|nr:hypothetical protein CFO_g3481 [Ceratocystis platani]
MPTPLLPEATPAAAVAETPQALITPPAPTRRKTPSERNATQISLFLLGTGFSLGAMFVTRRAIQRRRVSAVPQFFPSHAHVAFPERLQWAIAQVRTETAQKAGGELGAKAKAEGGMKAWVPRFLQSSSKSGTNAPDTTTTITTATTTTAATVTSPPPPPPSPPPSLDPSKPSDLETLEIAAMAASISPELARKRSDSAGLAAEALVLATSNVIAFALFCVAGFAIMLDIAEIEDLREYARRSVGRASGKTTPEEDEKAEKELESMAREFLDKFGIVSGENAGKEENGQAKNRDEENS